MITSIIIFALSLITNIVFIESLHRIKSYSFSTSYFLLHFLTNILIIIITLPYASTLFADPLGIDSDSDYKEYNYISYCYLILVSLHSAHILYQNKFIKWDENVHHCLTIIFWLIACYVQHPIYSVSVINVSGFPGGITYAMLFLKNLNYISNLTEKKISMELNIWIRSPFAVLFSTLMYGNLVYSEYNQYQRLCIIFMIIFNIYNGVHFMRTIIRSYYDNRELTKM